MAARTTAMRFDSFAVAIDNTGFAAVEGLETATLTFNQELSQTTAAAPSLWQDLCKSVRSATLSLGGGWTESNSPYCSAGSSINFDGTNAAKGVSSFTFNGNADTIDVTTLASAGYREVLPGRRQATVDFEGIYFDPAGTGANIATIYNNVLDGTTSCTIDLAWGASSAITGTAYGSQLSIERADNDAVKISGSAQYTGTVTMSTAASTILEKILDAWEAASELTFLLGESVSGGTKFTGSGYVTSVSVTVPYDGKIEWSATLEVDGAVTDYTYNT